MQNTEAECPGDPETSWRLLGCDNGLRYFQEVPCAIRPANSLWSKKLSVVKCVGVVDATADRVCSLLLDYGPTRTLWDSSVENAFVLESKDGKTDVLQLRMRHRSNSWCPRPKQLLLLRWWSKHQDGSYVIFFRTISTQSLKEQQCSLAPPASWLDCGAYIVRPLQALSAVGQAPPLSPHQTPKSPPTLASATRQRCVVELALEAEELSCHLHGWMQWLSLSLPQLDALPTNSQHACPAGCLCHGTSINMTLRNAMFHSIAGLREFCSATNGAPAGPEHQLSHRAHPQHPVSPPLLRGFSRKPGSPEPENSVAGLKEPLLGKAESEEAYEDCAVESLSDLGSELSEASFAAGVASVLRYLPALDRRVTDQEQAYPCNIDWDTFCGTVRRGIRGDVNSRNCWVAPEDTEFLVRGESFYSDGARVVAGPPLFQLVAVDWFHDKTPMPGVAQIQGGLVQRVIEHYKENAPYFMVLNLQVPAGSRGHYSLVFYFVTSSGSPCLQPGSLVHKFINASDDDYRKSRLTLIPSIPVGSWLVRNAVGSERFVMLADVLSTNYVRGEGFFEIDVNMGTSSVVSGIMGLVIPCMSMLTVDMAFLVKAEAGDHLPEELFGAVRCCYLEQTSAVAPRQ